jgi:hypothetical protein
MPHGIKGWAAFVVGQAVFTAIWKLIYKLLENAMIGWGDDQIAAYFGITSPTAATAFSWLLPLLLAGLTLWLYHLAHIRIAGHSPSPQSSGDHFSGTGIVGDGLPARTWIQKVEPYHVIILGLLIAAGGVAWMLYQSSESYRNSKMDRAAILIAPFQAQIDDLKKQLAARPPQAPNGSFFSTRKADIPVERDYTKRTVRDLRAFYEGRTRIQADAFMADEKGKLIEVEGTVVNIDTGMAFLNVGQDLHNGMTDSVECRFGPAWNAKLGTYRQKELMKVMGVIGPSQNGAQIYLQDCQIIDQLQAAVQASSNANIKDVQDQLNDANAEIATKNQQITDLLLQLAAVPGASPNHVGTGYRIGGSNNRTFKNKYTGPGTGFDIEGNRNTTSENEVNQTPLAAPKNPKGDSK